jgi:hypothetical protein
MRRLHALLLVVIVAFAALMIYLFMQNPNGVVAGPPPSHATAPQ